MANHTHHASHKNGRREVNYNLYKDLEKIKSAIAETAADTKGKTQEMLLKSIDEIQEKYFLMEKKTAAYVSEKPFKALGLSFLGGVILTALFLRRR